VSLGRYLTRYLLEPNVMWFKGKLARMVFTSSIFLASEMWHGGTGNYVLWGLFHGMVYFSYTRWLKKKDVPALLGIAAMVSFFVLGRFLAIDADFDRLLVKLANLFSPGAWVASAGLAAPQVLATVAREWTGISGAVAFLVIEGWGVRRYGVDRPYHVFRKPVMSFLVGVGFRLVGTNQGALLYGRI
jgi:hypothetical protein